MSGIRVEDGGARGEFLSLSKQARLGGKRADRESHSLV